MTSDNKYLHPLLSEPSKLRRESLKRKKPFETKSIKENDVQEFLDEGWEIDKRQKFRTRVRRPRPLDEKLENRVWLLLYQLGTYGCGIHHTFGSNIIVF